MARTVTTIFNMRENFSSGFRRASASTTDFQRKVTAAARALDREAKKRREIRIQSQNAHRAIAGVRSQIDKLKNVRINISARVQNFKRDMRPVTDSIKGVVRKPLMVTLKLKDMALAGLKKAGDLLRSLAKGATIGLGFVGAGISYALGKGKTLQEYEASISHNIFATNRNLQESEVQAQAQAYSDWLMDFQAKTTASLLDVYSGGSHALFATGGSVDAAKAVVKLAQDMVAQKPDKSLFDAVEAIRDAAQSGQYRRLLDFGFVLNAAAMEKAGGDIFKAKDPNGKTMLDLFTGAEERKAKTPAGIWATITGTLEGGIAQFGSNMLEGMKPLLLSLVPAADNISESLAGLGTDLGVWISDTVPQLGELWRTLKRNMQPLMDWLGEKWEMLQPFRDFVANAFASVNVDGKKVMGGIADAIDKMVNALIDMLNGLAQNWPSIEPVIAGLIRYLPQLALAFVGFKALSWGWKTGKAVGNFFGGAGDFLGRLFGRGKSAPTVQPAAGGDPVLDKPGTQPVKPSPGKNTFTGPNYNTFQGPNYNAGNGNGNGGDGGNPFNNGGIPQTPTPHLPLPGMLPLPLPGMSPLSLPAGSQPLGLPAGPGRTYQNIPTVGKARPGFNFSNLLNGLAGAGLLAAWTTGLENDARLHARAEQEIQKYEIEMPLHVIPDTSGLNGNMVSLLNGEAINGNLLLNFIPNPAGGNPLNQPLLTKNAAGIKRVPFDNYPTLLHKGEAVLPSGEASAFRAAGNRAGGAVINGVTVNINGANRDGRQIASEFVSELQHALFNLAPAPA